MLSTLLQMFALIGLGLFWSWYSPINVNDAIQRRVLTDLVYYLFLPALVLSVLWQTPLGVDTAKISLSAAAGVLSGLLASWLICRSLGVPRKITGAMMLASGFPNATYLGLPLLQSVFGPWARGIAIQYDLFACTPLLLTLGIGLASRFGRRGKKEHPGYVLLKVPALWAALIAGGLNLGSIPLPAGLEGLLNMLAGAVVPLMLIAVGMALRDGFSQWRYLPAAITVLIIQLLAMPALVYALASRLGLQGDMLTGVVLEAAMPSMVLGIVWCDRYGLNTGVYAAAMTMTTLLSLATLPVWFQWVS